MAASKKIVEDSKENISSIENEETPKRRGRPAKTGIENFNETPKRRRGRPSKEETEETPKRHRTSKEMKLFELVNGTSKLALKLTVKEINTYQAFLTKHDYGSLSATFVEGRLTLKVKLSKDGKAAIKSLN